MKKIIRLTESDLNRIVRKVLNEQNEKKINPPLQIKVRRYVKELMMDYRSVEMEPTGCIFNGYLRGEDIPALHRNFFECQTNKLFDGETSHSKELNISQQATKLFRTHCGCDNYVKNNNTSSIDV